MSKKEVACMICTLNWQVPLHSLILVCALQCNTAIIVLYDVMQQLSGCAWMTVSHILRTGGK